MNAFKYVITEEVREVQNTYPVWIDLPTEKTVAQMAWDGAYIVIWPSWSETALTSSWLGTYAGELL